MEEKQNQYLGELLLRLGNGEVSVLEEIYNILFKVLVSVGNIYYCQLSDIEDAIQDLLVTLYDKAKKFRENKNACAWVITIYQNQIKDKLKKAKTEQIFCEQLANAKIEYIDEIYIENHVFIKDMFFKLTEYEQQLIIYRFWCDCSINDLAKLFKKPKSTIQSQLEKLKSKIN